MTDLHIIQNEKIAISEISSYREHFKSDNIPFVIFGGVYNYSFEGFDNVITIEENFKGCLKLVGLMQKADRIHVHGFFSFWLLGLLAVYIKLCEKVVWYIWGDDFYCLTKPKTSLANRIHLALRRRVYKRVRYIATNVCGDYKLLCSIMQKKYEFIELRYGRGYISGIEPFVQCTSYHDSVNILVGNSATKSNYHLEVFDKLKKFRDENINIYVPLSYGSKDYADEVIKYGSQLFGEKFKPITEFMPKDKYFMQLMSMDIAVFANDRQQALGNIVALLYAGKKVYIRSDISSWESLHDEYGIGVCDYLGLDQEDFKKFITNSFDVHNQQNLINDMVDEDKCVDAMRRSLISEVES